MESFVSELAQEVRCSLCTDRFIEPKLLKCFHTYCKACIKRHAELQPDGEGNIFKCTECLAETSLPELNDVDDLNPSPLHTRILKVLEFVESDKVCSVSKSHSTASWYCFDCKCSLCSDCQSCHLMFTKTDYNHEIVSLSNLSKEDVEFMLAREDNCEDHVGYKLDFFCQDCKAIVCLVCMTRDHRDHKTIPNEKRSTTARASLEDHLETFDTREQELSSHLQALEDIAVKTRKEGERTIEEVKKKAKEIIEKVKQKERELIEEIQGKIENNEESKKEVQCILDQKKSTKRYINQMIEKKLPSSMTEQIIEMNVYSDDIVIMDVQDDSQMTFVVSEEYSRMLNAEFGTLASKPMPCKTLTSKSENDEKSGAKEKEYSSKSFHSSCKEETPVRGRNEKSVSWGNFIMDTESKWKCPETEKKEKASLFEKQRYYVREDKCKDKNEAYGYQSDENLSLKENKDDLAEAKEEKKKVSHSDYKQEEKPQEDEWECRDKGYVGRCDRVCSEETKEKKKKVSHSDHKQEWKPQEDEWECTRDKGYVGRCDRVYSVETKEEKKKVSHSDYKQEWKPQKDEWECRDKGYDGRCDRVYSVETKKEKKKVSHSDHKQEWKPQEDEWECRDKGYVGRCDRVCSVETKEEKKKVSHSVIISKRRNLKKMNGNVEIKATLGAVTGSTQ